MSLSPQELAQLRKQSRRKDAQIQALEAMQMRQNAVLQVYKCFPWFVLCSHSFPGHLC